MATTEFQTEIENGPLFNNAVTITMIADDTGVKLWGPVILADGAVQAMPHAASTTNAADRAVIGVCVRMPRDGNATVADTSVIEVCIHGICKVKVNDANVSLNDVLETNSTAGEARIQAAQTIRNDSTANAVADVIVAFDDIRAGFAIALSTVSSGADSIVACFVNIVPSSGADAA